MAYRMKDNGMAVLDFRKYNELYEFIYNNFPY